MITLRSFPGIWVILSSEISYPEQENLPGKFYFSSWGFGEPEVMEITKPLSCYFLPDCVSSDPASCRGPHPLSVPSTSFLGKRICRIEILSSSLGTRNTSLFILIHLWVSMLNIPSFQNRQAQKGKTSMSLFLYNIQPRIMPITSR